MTIFIHFAFILFTGSPVTGMLLELEKKIMYVEDVEVHPSHPLLFPLMMRGWSLEANSLLKHVSEKIAIRREKPLVMWV